MRRTQGILLARVGGWAVAVITLVTCGGSTPTKDPNEVDIPASDQQALSTSLGGLSAQMATNGEAQNAAAAAAAVLAIKSGSKATQVTVTPGAAARASRAAQSQKYQPVTASQIGIEVTLNNFPVNPSTRQFTGILSWTTGLTETILVYSAPSSGIFGTPPASGMLYVPPGAVWSPTAGTESSSVVSDIGPCPNTAALGPAVTSCTLAHFNGYFDITASTPDTAIPGNTATGPSPTASQAALQMHGVRLVVDCTQTSLCGAVDHSCVTPFKSSLSRTAGFNFDLVSPVMVVDASGNPWVAWNETGQSTAQTHVAHWTGNAWDTSYPVIQHGSAGSLGLVLLNGQPLVAFSDFDQSHNIYQVVTQLWNGTTWLATSQGTRSGAFDLTSDASGPLLARAESAVNQMPTAVVVSRFNGTSWMEIGRFDLGTQLISRPAIAADASGVFVAWEDGSSSPFTFNVRKLPSTDLGPFPVKDNNSTRSLSQLSLVTDGNGEPVLGYINYNGNAIEGVHVYRHANGSWTQMGGVVTPLLGGREYQLIRSGSTFAIAGLRGEVHEWNENAQSWGSLCSTLDPTASGITGVALAQDGNGKYLVAAINSGSGVLFVERTPTP